LAAPAAAACAARRWTPAGIWQAVSRCPAFLAACTCVVPAGMNDKHGGHHPTAPC
jgi:hypothetical protein